MGMEKNRRRKDKIATVFDTILDFIRFSVFRTLETLIAGSKSKVWNHCNTIRHVALVRLLNFDGRCQLLGSLLRFPFFRK